MIDGVNHRILKHGRGLLAVRFKIGIIGIPGKWSTETLADAVEERTGYRLVIDMAAVSLDLERQQLLFQDQDLCQLDALMVKKISGSPKCGASLTAKWVWTA